MAWSRPRKRPSQGGFRGGTCPQSHRAANPTALRRSPRVPPHGNRVGKGMSRRKRLSTCMAPCQTHPEGLPKASDRLRLTDWKRIPKTFKEGVWSPSELLSTCFKSLAPAGKLVSASGSDTLRIRGPQGASSEDLRGRFQPDAQQAAATGVASAHAWVFRAIGTRGHHPVVFTALFLIKPLATWYNGDWHHDMLDGS